MCGVGSCAYILRAACIVTVIGAYSNKINRLLILLFYYFIMNGVGTAATSGQLYNPHMIDEGDCGAIGGIKIGRGNRSTRRKLAPAPLCPPQIPHDQTQARTRAAVVGSQRLTV
jgi:hypothetical protein